MCIKQVKWKAMSACNSTSWHICHRTPLNLEAAECVWWLPYIWLICQHTFSGPMLFIVVASLILCDQTNPTTLQDHFTLSFLKAVSLIGMMCKSTYVLDELSLPPQPFIITQHATWDVAPAEWSQIHLIIFFKKPSVQLAAVAEALEYVWVMCDREK